MTSAPAWLGAAMHLHVRYAALASILWLCLWSIVPGSGFWLEAIVMLVLVCTLGLPHGALDYLAGRALFQPVFGIAWPAAFGLLYIGLGALVVVGWLLAPGLWLALMLVISAFHFGSDDSDRRLGHGFWRLIEIVGRGGSIIAVPSAVHTAEVAVIFGYLLPDLSHAQVSLYTEVGAKWLAPLTAVCLMVAAGRHAHGWLACMPLARSHCHALLEIVCVIAIFVVLPPLLAFTVYFCAWHSFRQILIVAGGLDQGGPKRALLAFARKAVLPTSAVVIAGTAAWAFGTTFRGELSAVISVVFLSLFALTVPHLLIQEIYKRASKSLREKRPLGFT